MRSAEQTEAEWWTNIKTCRCFLFLVNYARMRPDPAVHAIQILEAVG